MTRYAGYDLNKIKQGLAGHPWEAVLRPFQYVRMATPAQLEAATGLSRGVVKRTLDVLTAVEDVAEDPRPTQAEAEADSQPEERLRYVLALEGAKVAHRIGQTKPATVYRLGKAGAALLREMGLIKDTRENEMYETLSVKHRLCTLDVILAGVAEGQTTLLAEKKLFNGDGLELRPDVALPEQATSTVPLWHMVAVEQAAGEFNGDRIERQLDRWWAFFTGAPGQEPVAESILMVFNVRLAALPETLAEWQNALGVVAARRGELPFELHYQLLADFLELPEWNPLAWARLPRLQPNAKYVAPVEPWRDPLDSVPARADLNGLFAKALAIYRLSRGENDPVSQYSVPVASLRALRAWLDTPEMAQAKQTLRLALNKLAAYQGTLIAVSLLDKIVWDVLLRQFGVDRQHIGPQGDLQIAATAPVLSNADKVCYGDYHVRVAMSEDFMQKLEVPGLVLPYLGADQPVAALEWLLSAPYTYAYELGLRDEPWLATSPARKKKGQKRK